MTMSTVEFDRIGFTLAERIQSPTGIAAATPGPASPAGRRAGAGASIAVLLVVVALVLRFAHMLSSMPGALLG